MMKNKFFGRCLCSLCAVCLLCVGATSCMSAEKWRELNGTSVQLPDLITLYLNDTYGSDPRYYPIPGPSPYFVGEITAIKEGYMVVKPLSDQRIGKVPSYADELLKHGENVIVPFWVEAEKPGEYSLLSVGDSAVVGDFIRVYFEQDRVVSDTSFGSKTLVLCVANSLTLVKDNE